MPTQLHPKLKSKTKRGSNKNLLDGDILYQIRAREVLPYLVRQAKASKTITYSDLASEMGMPNARNLNHVLGAVGNALAKLSEQLIESVPLLQCIVVNKTTGQPGAGLGWIKPNVDYRTLDKVERDVMMEIALAKVYKYQYWDWVLNELGLHPLTILTETELIRAGMSGNGGESLSHKLLKEYISANPSVVGLHGLNDGQMEELLPSADRIDVVFQDNNTIIGIEVKSIISSEDDLLRGLFQCVKYKHLIEAKQVVSNLYPNSRVILAIEGKLTAKLRNVKKLLGIEVIEGIVMR